METNKFGKVEWKTKIINEFLFEQHTINNLESDLYTLKFTKLDEPINNRMMGWVLTDKVSKESYSASNCQEIYYYLVNKHN